ncbi:MAG: hypothetical protein V1838_02595 [Patescibacteria group bacterium]
METDKTIKFIKLDKCELTNVDVLADPGTDPKPGDFVNVLVPLTCQITKIDSTGNNIFVKEAAEEKEQYDKDMEFWKGLIGPVNVVTNELNEAVFKARADGTKLKILAEEIGGLISLKYKPFVPEGTEYFHLMEFMVGDGRVIVLLPFRSDEDLDGKIEIYIEDTLDTELNKFIKRLTDKFIAIQPKKD